MLCVWRDWREMAAKCRAWTLFASRFKQTQKYKGIFYVKEICICSGNGWHRKSLLSVIVALCFTQKCPFWKGKHTKYVWVEIMKLGFDFISSSNWKEIKKEKEKVKRGRQAWQIIMAESMWRVWGGSLHQFPHFCASLSVFIKTLLDKQRWKGRFKERDNCHAIKVTKRL